MEIILGKTAGFCYGVKTAVTNAEEKLKEYNLTLMEFLPLSLEEVFMFENGGEANV